MTIRKGYGDPETWKPFVDYPHDPRCNRDEQVEIEDLAEEIAAELMDDPDMVMEYFTEGGFDGDALRDFCAKWCEVLSTTSGDIKIEIVSTDRMASAIAGLLVSGHELIIAAATKQATKQIGERQ